MIDDFAKAYLHDNLRWAREALLWKLDGLSEYDVRRPLTATGTNLLGLVKHLTGTESRYFGEVFDRPSPGPLPHWEDGSWWPRPDVKLFNEPASRERHRARVEQAARAAADPMHG